MPGSVPPVASPDGPQPPADAGISVGTLDAGSLTRLVDAANQRRAEGDAAGALRLLQAAAPLAVGDGRDWRHARAALANALGLALFDRGELAAATRHLRSALSGWRRVRPADPGHLAAALNNLGLVAEAQSRPARAARLHRLALTLRERAAAPHSSTQVAQSLVNLGSALRALGRHDEAGDRLRRAHALFRKARGDGHRSTANAARHLALLRADQGRWRDAEALLRPALTAVETMLPAGDWLHAALLNDLGAVLENLGQAAAAEGLHRRALAIREASLGPGHADVARSREALAVALSAQGRHGAAEDLLRQALADKQAALGADHPSVAISLYNLAVQLCGRREWAAALPLLRRCLAIRWQRLGTDHALTRDAVELLARLERQMA